MRFLILGAGALGGYFGGKLLKGGADVTFLVRPRRAAQLADHGLVVNTHEDEIRCPVKTLQAGQVTSPYDVIIMCCKAYDLPAAMDAVAPAVGPGTGIWPVLNGVKHISTLSERFGREQVLGGLTAVNAALMPSGDIVQSPVKIDLTKLGELDGRISQRCLKIQEAFAASGTKVELSDTIMAWMWTKFHGFTSVAVIATLCRSRAGAIAAAHASPAFIDDVLDEVGRVASAEGYPPPTLTTEQVRGLFSNRDSAYGPSILVDMEEGRQTEGEHTVGDMLDRARKHNLAAPLLTAALCNLQAYEARRQAR